MPWMEPQVEELPDNRVRLTVDVPRAQLEHAVEHAASDLAENAKIPGFRQGKVPMPVLLARVGRERLHSEAVESHIGGWFMNAAARSRIRPVEQPEYDYELPETPDEDWHFTATVSVQPKPEPADWTQLEVPAPEAEVPEEIVEHELNVLRSSVAELTPGEGRPAQPGDTYVVELGAGRLVPELERALVGMSPGDTQEVRFERSEDEAGTVELAVKELKEKVLPPLDDDLARAASEFDTLDELRSDIESHLRRQIEEEIEGAVRAAAVDRLVEATGVQASGPLVDARARTLLNNLARSLAARGLSLETYVQLSGVSPEQLTEQIRGEAAQSVARELVLEGVADKLGIDVPDEEVEALVREEAQAAGDDPDELLQRLRDAGTSEDLREDIRLRAALDRVAADRKSVV